MPELQRSLPDTPPEAARATLERCRQLQKRVEIELLRVREVLLLELGRVRQAQRTADGYAPVRRQPAWSPPSPDAPTLRPADGVRRAQGLVQTCAERSFAASRR